MSYGEKMTIKNEHLSTVFDNEASDSEQRRLVNKLLEDNELQQTWSNYALIGDVLREPEKTGYVAPSFLSGIQERLEEDEQSLPLNEHLSAVFDDEAGEFEQRRLLDELGKDHQLLKTWSNYALLSDVLREPEQTEIASPDFLLNIQQKLEKEEQFSNVEVKTATTLSNKKPKWARPITGFALAATVAAVSVFSMQSFMTADNGDIDGTMLSQKAVPTTMNTLMASNEAVSRNVVNMEQRIKMQRYLASHIKNASRRTIAPSMRMISYNY